MLLPLRAQDFATHWIGCTDAGEGQHVFFRQTYLTDALPKRASVRVATTGLVKVYVNQCNVFLSSFYPYRPTPSDVPHAVTVDVTPYLRSDTNVVAVMYAPAWPHEEPRQVAVTFFGERADGSRFSYVSDSDWVCMPAPSGWLGEGTGEWMDATQRDPDWNAATYASALWTSAEETDSPTDTAWVEDRFDYTAWRVRHVRGMRYFDLEGDSVQYEFGDGFMGRLRLTLRETRRGECIVYGPNVYYCNGELDEQACPEFFVDSYRRVLIWGDSHFQRDQIVNIEAVEMAPEEFSATFFPSFQP